MLFKLHVCLTSPGMVIACPSDAAYWSPSTQVILIPFNDPCKIVPKSDTDGLTIGKLSLLIPKSLNSLKKENKKNLRMSSSHATVSKFNKKELENLMKF